MEEALLNLVKSSPSLGLALLIIYWFKQTSEKYYTATIQSTNDRINAMDKEIVYLRLKSDTCEKDRQFLGQEIVKMKAAAGMKFSLVEKVLGERSEEQREQSITDNQFTQPYERH